MGDGLQDMQLNSSVLGALFEHLDRRQHLAFHKLQESAPAGRNIGYLRSHAVFIDGCESVPATSNGERGALGNCQSERLGAFKRKGWKSLMRDEWVMMDAADQDVGVIKEDSAGRAALRRLMAFAAINLIPQKYHCEIDGKLACTFQQNFNPLVTKIVIDFSVDGESFGSQTSKLDKKMGLAAGVLLSAIEGKQSG